MTNSQAYQDIFALSVSKNKSYIEIGGNRPKKWNNTYALEKQGYKGFSLERNTKWQNQWAESDRINPIYWDDALTFDYSKAMLENNMSGRVGYLSCDIEPASNTFKALQRVISQGIEFDCITFEDDRYDEKDPYDQYAIDFLKGYGYKLAVKDVYTLKEKNLFETWFVKDDIDFTTCTFEEWLRSNT